ncbi:MAG: hypothetical protein KIH08_16530 [Candidatus Freyarchaeota archaeon]|nr:hypothetical protein [Candidatus Jordarchaeia archaeon]MBS7270050.1 hypothetical protein [Candidatus Jordarchaeia archaeon]
MKINDTSRGKGEDVEEGFEGLLVESYDTGSSFYPQKYCYEKLAKKILRQRIQRENE